MTDQIRANYSVNVLSSSFFFYHYSWFLGFKRETKSKLKQRRDTADERFDRFGARLSPARLFSAVSSPAHCSLCWRSRSQRGGDGHISQAKQRMSPRQHKAEELLGGVSSLISEWAGLFMYLWDLYEVSQRESRLTLRPLALNQLKRSKSDKPRREETRDY